MIVYGYRFVTFIFPLDSLLYIDKYTPSPYIHLHTYDKFKMYNFLFSCISFFDGKYIFSIIFCTEKKASQNEILIKFFESLFFVFLFLFLVFIYFYLPFECMLLYFSVFSLSFAFSIKITRILIICTLFLGYELGHGMKTCIWLGIGIVVGYVVRIYYVLCYFSGWRMY